MLAYWRPKSVSEYQLPVWPNSNHIVTSTKQKSPQMPCEVSAGTNWIPGNTEKPLGHQWCPREDAKIVPSADPEPLPKITKRKKKLDNPPESWQQISRTPNCKWGVAHISVQPNIGGTPSQWLPSQVLRTQNKTNKKAVAVPGRERIITSGSLKANSQVTVQRSTSCICFLPASMNFERKGKYEIFPSSLNQAPQRCGIADCGKNCPPLLAPASFPRIWRAGSGASRVFR